MSGLCKALLLGSNAIYARLLKQEKVLHALKDKRVLITGSSGLLGTTLIYAIDYLNSLWGTNCHVTALDMRPFNPVDLLQPALFRSLTTNLIYADQLPPGPAFDYAFALAGIASPVAYEKRPYEALMVSVKGLDLVLQSAVKGARVVFSSSSEVYATPPSGEIPTRETYIGAVEMLGKRAPYDIGKLAGETLCWIHNQQFPNSAVVVRFFNAFGPGLVQADQRILVKLAESIKRGEPLTVYRPGEVGDLPTRTYCPAANSVYGLLLAAVSAPTIGPYNIGLDSPELTVPQLASRAAMLGFKAPEVKVVPAPGLYSNEPRRRCPSIEKAKNELGYAPVMSLEDGLKLYLDWALEAYV